MERLFLSGLLSVHGVSVGSEERRGPLHKVELRGLHNSELTNGSCMAGMIIEKRRRKLELEKNLKNVDASNSQEIRQLPVGDTSVVVLEADREVGDDSMDLHLVVRRILSQATANFEGFS